MAGDPATRGDGGVRRRLLARQDADGRWDGGAHLPAGYFDSAEARQPVQPWTATSWSLNQLREWGVDAAVLGDTAERLARTCRWEYEDLPFWGGEVDVCINAFTLASHCARRGIGARSICCVAACCIESRRVNASARSSRQADGTWLQGSPLPGRTWFPVDAAQGEPSRWLTLIGTRALDWAEDG